MSTNNREINRIWQELLNINKQQKNDKNTKENQSQNTFG